jgi:hypothetical protein
LTVKASAQVALATAHFPVLVSHFPPCEQSASPAQVFLHTPLLESQANGTHGVVPPAAQAPVPSHVDAAVETSPVQLAGAQLVALPG